MKTICQAIGHIWKAYHWQQEKCWRCEIIIESRAAQSKRMQESGRLRIKSYLTSEKHLKNISRYALKADPIFSGGASAKVANALYYMRYVRGMSVDRIRRYVGCTESSLNAYLVCFPAIVRDGKIIALIER